MAGPATQGISLGEGVCESLFRTQDAVNQVVTTVQALVKRLDVIGKSMERSIENTQKTNELLSFGPRMTEANEKILGEVKFLSANQGEVQKLFQKVLMSIIQIDQALMANNPMELLSAQREATAKLNDILLNGETITKTLHTLIETQKESDDDLLKSIKDANGQIIQEAKVISSTQSDGQKMLQKIIHSLTQIDQSLAANNPRDLLASQKEAVSRLGEIFAGNQTQIRLASSILEAQKDGGSDLATSLRNLQAELSKLEEVNIGAAKHLWDIKEGLATASGSIAALDGMAENISRQTTLIEEVNKETRNPQSILLVNLRQELDDLVDKLKNEPTPTTSTPVNQ
jgi:hypothetical protein